MLKAKPVIKWVGGKRQLLGVLEEKMPSRYGTYFEPFFGGGALFFDLAPKDAVINDFNPQLVNLYRQIKNHSAGVMKLLKVWEAEYNSLDDMSAKNAYYYQKRVEYNDCLTSGERSVKSAALLIFLNKSGFNGLYRINQAGLYNVAAGHKKKLSLFDEDNFVAVKQALQHAQIKRGDFEKACRSAKKGDFVFFDSPYYDSFDTYQAGGFSATDHARLAQLFSDLSDAGVYCMLTNNNCDYVKELYSGYNIEEVDVRRMVNCDSSKRTGTEVIVTNY